MRIVHVSAEFAPIAKAGGLGEVLVGLSRELTQTSYETQAIIPKYDLIDESKIENYQKLGASFECLGYKNQMFEGKVENCKVLFLKTDHPKRYFDRGQIYACEDDVERFLYFSRAVLEYFKQDGQPIDILHIHDWHVSILASLIKGPFKSLPIKAIVLSIHNIEHQGKCLPESLDRIGMDGICYLGKEKMQDENPSTPDLINLLKGGIVYSDAVVPVSLTYAKEILTPGYSFHLHPTLKKHSAKIHGILNGIDTKIWDPEHDHHLKMNYSFESVLMGKKANRSALALSQNHFPWIASVTRLVPQKGIELIEAAIEKTVELGGTFILLGSSPIVEIQRHFEKVKEKYQDNPQVYLCYEYSEKKAHLIYAAADLLLVPSHFEPCGLTQMIAMRYGTVPIVRETGGLKDTVFDLLNAKIEVEKRNGFTFKNADRKDLFEALEKAFDLYINDPATFRMLLRRGMHTDFSWEKPAKEYLKLYRNLLKRFFDVSPVCIDVIPNRNESVKSGYRDRKEADLLKKIEGD